MEFDDLRFRRLLIDLFFEYFRAITGKKILTSITKTGNLKMGLEFFLNVENSTNRKRNILRFLMTAIRA